MKYSLKDTTAKKLREQLYLGLFFGFIIWVLMAFLFIGDNSQTIIIYLIGSAIIIPYLYKKHISPFFKNLDVNTQNAYFEIKENTVIFNHFDNLKQFDQEQIELQIADIVDLKKAFRKDDSVNKLTLTVKGRKKTKIIVENFENMEEMVEILIQKMSALQNANGQPNSQQ